jgi:hypothetical protein
VDCGENSKVGDGEGQGEPLVDEAGNWNGERWFCTEQEAQAAGWRKAGNCP